MFHDFFCPEGATSQTVFRINYGTLNFELGGSPGNPTTNTFYIGSKCEVSSTIKIEIDGTSCDNPIVTDLNVVITFPSLDGYSYIEEQVYVGLTTTLSQTLPESSTSKLLYRTANTAPGVSDTCTIPLETFLAGAGISPNTGWSGANTTTFNIVTHAALNGPSG